MGESQLIYTAFRAKTVKEMVESIQSHINKGFMPIGGIMPDKDGYVQSMVMEVNVSDEEIANATRG